MGEYDESPHTKLLNQGHAADAKTGHKATLGLIDDLTQYGVNLASRCYAISPMTMEDILVCHVLLKQVVAMLDGIRVLTAEAAMLTAPLQLRGGLEASLYIDWVLKTDTRRRANAYFVGELRRRREHNTKLSSGAFDHYFADTPPAELAQLKQEAAAQAAAATRTLAGPEQAPLEAAFSAERARRVARNPNADYDPTWHEVAGMRTVRQIAVDVGRQEAYEWIYSPTSWVMHAVNLTEHVEFRATDDIAILPIRNPNVGTVFANNLHGAAVTLAVETYRSVLLHYRPEEEPNFARRYVEQWRGLMKRRGIS